LELLPCVALLLFALFPLPSLYEKPSFSVVRGGSADAGHVLFFARRLLYPKVFLLPRSDRPIRRRGPRRRALFLMSFFALFFPLPTAGGISLEPCRGQIFLSAAVGFQSLFFSVSTPPFFSQQGGPPKLPFPATGPFPSPVSQAGASQGRERLFHGQPAFGVVPSWVFFFVAVS